MHPIVEPIRNMSFSLEYIENHLGSLLLSRAFSRTIKAMYQHGRLQRKPKSVFAESLFN